MTGKCKCCEQEKDLRFGVCFDCSDCETVIATGLDMWDQPIPTINNYSIQLAKVKYIINKFNKPLKDE